VEQVGSAHWYTRLRERIQDRYTHFRERVRSRPAVDLAYRVAVGVVGTAVLVLGIIAIPWPGPGWLIVFAGLAILGTEFVWARRVGQFLRRRYDAWTRWLRGRPAGVRLLVMAGTLVVILLTLWSIDAFGMVAGWVGLQWDWVRSPLA